MNLKGGHRHNHCFNASMRKEIRSKQHRRISPMYKSFFSEFYQLEKRNAK